jgi:hypothetical protein
MKIKEKIKNIKWLIENKKEIEGLISKKKTQDDFALGGVPEFQKDYIAKLLKED